MELNWNDKNKFESELYTWSERGIQAIKARTFQPTVVGYWTPETAITQEASADYFCLSFPSPQDDAGFEALISHLKLQLFYNNVQAYIYLGAQNITGAASETALVVLGVNQKESFCWFTPFLLEGKETKVFPIGMARAEVFSPWNTLMPKEGPHLEEIHKSMVGLHAHLKGKSALREGDKDVAEYFSAMGEENLFEGIPSKEIFKLCLMYLTSRLPAQEFDL